jgi:ketosteroid isomerase-like protein
LLHVSEDVQALIRRTWDTFDTADEEGFLACFAPGWVEHYGELTATVEDALGALRRYADELTERETTLERVVVQGEWAAVRTTRRATHRATRKPVHVHEISLHRIENGRLAESWTESSSASVLEQIGA